jgi:hypothetical protein
MSRGLRRQTRGLLILAAAALVYLLIRYGADAPWSWR